MSTDHSHISAQVAPGPDDSASLPPSEHPWEEFQARNKRFMRWVLFVIVLSTAFGWGSIWLYRMACHNLFPGGTSAENGTAVAYTDVKVDDSRTVRVRLAANVEKQLDWDFQPLTEYVNVHPGARTVIYYTARNDDAVRTITGKAVYAVDPATGWSYLKKSHCFCFASQTLKPGQSKKMKVVFWLDPSIPAKIRHMTVAFTFFKVKEGPVQVSRDQKAEVMK